MKNEAKQQKLWMTFDKTYAIYKLIFVPLLLIPEESPSRNGNQPHAIMMIRK